MKKNFFSVAVLLAALMLAACSGGCSTPWGTIRRNIENSRNLRVGMTKGEVLEIMGEPIRDENFCKPDLWYYYIDMVWGDGLTTEDECMPLVFENGLLIGWGNDFYVSYRLKRKNEAPVHNQEPEPPAKTTAPATDAKPAAAETAPAADAKPAVETKPAADAKPAAETKPAEPAPVPATP